MFVVSGGLRGGHVHLPHSLGLGRRPGHLEPGSQPQGRVVLACSHWWGSGPLSPSSGSLAGRPLCWSPGPVVWSGGSQGGQAPLPGHSPFPAPARPVPAPPHPLGCIALYLPTAGTVGPPGSQPALGSWSEAVPPRKGPSHACSHTGALFRVLQGTLDELASTAASEFSVVTGLSERGPWTSSPRTRRSPRTPPAWLDPSITVLGQPS